MDPEDNGQGEEAEGEDEAEMLSDSSVVEDDGQERDESGFRIGVFNIMRDRNVARIFRGFRGFNRESSSGSEDSFQVTTPSNEESDNSDSASNNQPQNFDTELPTNHSYLGRMESVSGVEYYEPGSRYKIHICPHHTIIFPGQTLPVILSTSQAFHLTAQSGEHSVGLVFPPINNEQYGVTCQMYEKNVRNPLWKSDLRAKLRAHQRFRVCKGTISHPILSTFVGDVREAEVEILPELSLGDPLSGHIRGSLDKFLPHSSRIKLLYSHARAWPLFVYEQYDIGKVMMKIKHFVAAHNLENMPTDPIVCSFWSAKNLPLEESDREKIFATNFVEVRMKIIAEKLNDPYYYHCIECQQKVAKFSEVFAMSKDGVQASYCNPGGFIHDTVTLFGVELNAVIVERSKSTQFSWFPGYAWKITVCGRCHRHLGWQFVAEKKNLRPHSFFGLTQRSIVLKL
ncbi:protein cereblon [Phlebotomus argentipes]|uniref:protein cereblon n=1 Tax=Phlebotomus argentipes TaxID=94469 RepID=UPI002893235E|nr:protein cereblon [Phlebotomus argentipes]